MSMSESARPPAPMRVPLLLRRKLLVQLALSGPPLLPCVPFSLLVTGGAGLLRVRHANAAHCVLHASM